MKVLIAETCVREHEVVPMAKLRRSKKMLKRLIGQRYPIYSRTRKA
jgi:hypothetical protein